MQITEFQNLQWWSSVPYTSLCVTGIVWLVYSLRMKTEFGEVKAQAQGAQLASSRTRDSEPMRRPHV